jgi:hypothetical protein
MDPKLKVSWSDFKHAPLASFKKRHTDRLRITMQEGAFINVYLHDKWEEGKVENVQWTQKWGNNNDLSKINKVKIVRHCKLCKGKQRLVFVIPYNAKTAPGWYCRYCRAKYSIYDVSQHGKIRVLPRRI